MEQSKSNESESSSLAKEFTDREDRELHPNQCLTNCLLLTFHLCIQVYFDYPKWLKESKQETQNYVPCWVKVLE